MKYKATVKNLVITVNTLKNEASERLNFGFRKELVTEDVMEILKSFRELRKKNNENVLNHEDVISITKYGTTFWIGLALSILTMLTTIIHIVLWLKSHLDLRKARSENQRRENIYINVKEPQIELDRIENHSYLKNSDEIDNM